MTQDFDFEKALESLKSGVGLNGKDVILTPLLKIPSIPATFIPVHLIPVPWVVITHNL